MEDDEWTRVQELVYIYVSHNSSQLRGCNTKFTLADFYASWIELKFNTKRIWNNCNNTSEHNLFTKENASRK